MGKKFILAWKSKRIQKRVQRSNRYEFPMGMKIIWVLKGKWVQKFKGARSLNAYGFQLERLQLQQRVANSCSGGIKRRRFYTNHSATLSGDHLYFYVLALEQFLLQTNHGMPDPHPLSCPLSVLLDSLVSPSEKGTLLSWFHRGNEFKWAWS